MIELLVTVSIMMLLVFVAMPVMTPTGESRRLREAARAMNVFFGAARTQAMQSGRPVGVMLERFPRVAQASVILYQVEVPPPYCGDAINSSVRVAWLASTNTNAAQFNLTFSGFSGWGTTVRVGDQIQFNNQGPLYTLLAATRAELDTRDGKRWPWTTSWSQSVPFKIFRQPIRSPVTPLEMPSNVAIDFQASGTETYLNWFAPLSSDVNTNYPTPVALMFSPSGSLDRVYFSQAGALGYRLIQEPIYLLIGRRDRIQTDQNLVVAPPTPPEQYPNWFDAASIWFTISPPTGMTAAKENFRVPLNATYRTPTPNGIRYARTLARQAEAMRGR